MLSPLLIDDGSRHRSYCLLLLRHLNVDEEVRREQGAKYGLEDEIDALLRYLEAHGEVLLVIRLLPLPETFLAVPLRIRL